MKTYLCCMGALFASFILLPSLAFSGGSAAPEEKPKSEETPDEITLIDGAEEKKLSLEDYIEGVVLAEMPASYNEEALKAQAVAARTYAVNKMRSRVHEGGALCADFSCCQAYIAPENYTGGEDNLSKVKKAVSETKGVIMTYDGEPITAVFHSMSAGKTAAASDVWGSDVPYLKSVDSSLEKTEENYETTVTVPITEFTGKLSSLSSDYKGDLTIPPPERDSGGYVKRITIGSVTFSGNAIRNLFSLRSTNFNLGFSDGYAVFTVRGYGHGVGMSQHGANLLAEKGENYKEILKTYYTGIKFDRI